MNWVTNGIEGYKCFWIGGSYNLNLRLWHDHIPDHVINFTDNFVIILDENVTLEVTLWIAALGIKIRFDPQWLTQSAI